jgi:hypothetical protein
MVAFDKCIVLLLEILENIVQMDSDDTIGQLESIIFDTSVSEYLVIFTQKSVWISSTTGEIIDDGWSWELILHKFNTNSHPMTWIILHLK